MLGFFVFSSHCVGFTIVNDRDDYVISEQIDFIIEALKIYPEQSIDDALDRSYT